MKLISWNVNGIRAAMNKGFYEFFEESSPDVLCIQESKMQEGQAEILTDGYYQYFNSAEKKGYSGTITFTKTKPLSVSYGIGEKEHDNEGRVITCEFNEFYLINVYTPNSGEGLKRLEYRMQWDKAFLAYVKELEKSKPVIICGDLNVAHTEIDLKNPKTNRKNAGFTDEERNSFTHILEDGKLIDSFRYFYPDLEGAYSWWSYRFNARANNAGWRIDYFLVSEKLKDKLVGASILSDVYGSDHCPVTLDIKAN
ncbi:MULTISPECIES: exodeoxyribonuclease III [unclassified Breznakia]|uniref:exodeoxyribonuclease III n=1 Tax=unclassified Breznakia TaxID=2623764 RepID=UPI002476AFED|nr:MULTISPECIES: exodeoxyribonuclease III [unclassified Breznakia]MDH6367706.1 exodeoxyribonuclease-3 [Breznakia sp. PH1-1]MDH6404794.1 exodeoxyribonuclease-3 [Breznakia sp. PF1-11]MDH6412499.1 exodeoxyribonuclease-3 [Breznakia sp. PFB1-11]MDH6414859.1 exodeoxyribonuclease-3 [Breznakia sp. PFB1-14]MDH6417170.1 exodeoxyribonuclease-3 [Breznakia sp. PFB1-4]